MGFQGHYKKLHKGEEEGGGGGNAAVAPRPRRARWLRKGKARCFRLCSPSKRLRWARFSIVLAPKRVSELYAEVVRAVRVDHAVVFPTINLCSQWGLPVLSHPKLGGAKERPQPVSMSMRKLSPY